MPPLTEDEKRRLEDELLQNPDLPDEQRRRIKRRASNRESARRTRQKRTESLKTYEERAQFMRAENDKILGQISELEKLYFDAVLQNRQLKGDIQIIRASKPHLNQLCPPTVTSSAVTAMSTQPFTESLYGSGGVPPQLPHPLHGSGTDGVPAGHHMGQQGSTYEDMVAQGVSLTAALPHSGAPGVASMGLPTGPGTGLPFKPYAAGMPSQDLQEFLAQRILKAEPPTDTATNLTSMLDQHQNMNTVTNLTNIVPGQAPAQSIPMLDSAAQPPTSYPPPAAGHYAVPDLQHVKSNPAEHTNGAAMEHLGIPLPGMAPSISPAGGLPPPLAEHAGDDYGVKSEHSIPQHVEAPPADIPAAHPGMDGDA